MEKLSGVLVRAARTVHRLGALLRRIRGQIVHRALDTVSPLARAKGHKLDVRKGLAEMHFGAWEGQSAAELMATEPEALAAFWEDPLAHPPPGAVHPVEAAVLRVPDRPFSQVVAAFEHALDPIQHDDATSPWSRAAAL